MLKKEKFDIYIDEDKLNGVLWFLIIKNTPYFQQILYNKRQKFNTYYEIHFKELNNNSIKISKSWINLFLNFEKIYDIEKWFCLFEKRKWNKKINDKEKVIKCFLKDFIEKNNTKNIVLFLDFDTEHKKTNLENILEKWLKICRVFHLDSKSTDLLQLVDLLLATSVRWKKWILNDINFNRYNIKLKEWKYLTKWELKSYLSSYLYKQDNLWKIKK